ncbi:hypothetical protein ACFE04_008696 [Oxalis oulophora]
MGKSGGQKQLIYSFVARGTVILAEYTEFTGNFTTVASQCLQKLPASNNRFTYNCDGHTFNYLVENAFCVVAVESAGRQTPIAFLERIKEDFSKKYVGGKAKTAAAKSLNKEFGSKLKDQMQYCVDHPEEINKLAKVKAQVSEVKGVMMENIEKVLDRGEKIELLVDKTEDLRSQPWVLSSSCLFAMASNVNLCLYAGAATARMLTRFFLITITLRTDRHVMAFELKLQQKKAELPEANQSSMC